MMNAPVSAPTSARSPELFGEHFAQMLNHAAIVAMTSLGHRLGLFDTLASLPPSTSHQISDASGLNERYIREWLSVMVTGGIIDYQPTPKTFSLDSAHAACLTRSASPDNLAVTARFIPLISSMETALMTCFRTGEGLPYNAYPCFHEVMAEDSHQTVVSALFNHILPLAPGLQERLERGISVLDAGCGRGLALLALAQAFPNSRFTGYDLCEEAFEPTREKARARRLTNLFFDARDLRNFRDPASYDLITSFDAVHDQADPAALLRGISEALRPGGMYLMQDIAGSSFLENNLEHPLGPLLYTISCAHCTPVSLAQGGPGLGTLWGEEKAELMLRQAGFHHIESHRLEHDPFNVYFIARNEEGKTP
ncbi:MULTISPECIES: class I SAM-dependent methyltransferase [Marinobacter]|uniref:class I SAM-dependent methyltransferase n=1 Tax=Marinobacter TaxID=2742 RepID=UPI001925A4D3|nr:MULTISPECIES: class I SAM-dependent methyltransferase [Marinobacter]MBL3558146.1 methyltransferase domain-containing protein [Marinobacter sp. JB05H06]